MLNLSLLAIVERDGARWEQLAWEPAHPTWTTRDGCNQTPPQDRLRPARNKRARRGSRSKVHIQALAVRVRAKRPRFPRASPDIPRDVHNTFLLAQR